MAIKWNFSVAMALYLRDALEVLAERRGESRSQTTCYLFETMLAAELGESVIDKLRQRHEVTERMQSSRLSRGHDPLHEDARLIAGAPNMSNDVEAIYQALKAGESLERFDTTLNPAAA